MWIYWTHPLHLWFLSLSEIKSTEFICNTSWNLHIRRLHYYWQTSHKLRIKKITIKYIWIGYCKKKDSLPLYLPRFIYVTHVICSKVKVIISSLFFSFLLPRHYFSGTKFMGLKWIFTHVFHKKKIMHIIRCFGFKERNPIASQITK